MFASSMTAATSAGMGTIAAGANAGALSGMVSGAVNGVGMGILGGGNFSDVMSAMSMGIAMGTLTGAAGAAANFGTNQLIGKVPLHNTISYLAGSGASRITANIISGRGVFDSEQSIFNDPGLILPLFADLGPRFTQVRDNIHKEKLDDLNNDPDIQVKGVVLSKTEIQSNGDLYLESLYHGKKQFELVRHGTKLEFGPLRLVPTVKRHSFSMPYTWDLNSQFIPNYSGLVQLFTTRYN